MPPSAPAQAPPLPLYLLPRLTADSHLLHLLHHRNRNQHRTSLWYKSLSLLHRHLRHFIRELSLIPTATSTPEKQAYEKAAEARRVWLRDVVVPRAFVDFSRVVRDRQFVSLGAALMGVLAGVWKGVGEGFEIEDMEAVGEEAEEEEVAEAVGEVADRGDVEEGVVISRALYAGSEADEEETEEWTPMDTTGAEAEEVVSSPPAKKATKKKRRSEDPPAATAKPKQKKPAVSYDSDSSATPVKAKKASAIIPEERKKKRKDKPLDSAAPKKKKKRRADDELDALFDGLF